MSASADGMGQEGDFMLLTIVIPHYNEPYEIVKPLLDMLDIQKGVDFNDFKVMLVHNGDVNFTYTPMNFKLETYTLTKRGVSNARNFGIDHADSEWICFCDCDDNYVSIFSLMMVFHILKDENAKEFDLIWGSFYMHGSGDLIKAEQYNNVFIHNKYYRLSTLKERNIYFNENLRMSEDSAFNTLFRLEVNFNRVGQINSKEPLYAWCRRPGSITMDIDKWIYNTEGHFDRNLYVLDLYRWRHLSDSDNMVARTLTDAYAMLNKKGIRGDQTAIRKRLRAFYLENKVLFERVPEKTIQAALKISDKDACVHDYDIAQRPSFEDWLKGLIDGEKKDE